MWGFAASPPKRNNAAARAAAKAQLNVYRSPTASPARSPAGPRKTARANGVKPNAAKVNGSQAVGGRKTRRSVRRTRRVRA